MGAQAPAERYRYLSARLKMANEASILCLDSGDFAGLSAAIAEQRDIAFELADLVNRAEKVEGRPPTGRLKI